MVVQNKLLKQHNGCNYEKPKTMVIATRQMYHRMPEKILDIVIDNLQLENTETEKLLDIKIDQHLSWKNHIDKVHKTASMILAQFRRIKPFLPTDARIRFCRAFILPHLDYCSIVWGSAQLENCTN